MKNHQLIVPPVPDQARGDWVVDRFTVTKAMAEETRRAAIFALNRWEYVPPGDYVRLKRGSVTVMSDTLMERQSHMTFLYRATGRVLINGLGLGMIAHSCALKPDVKSVDVVEADADVIAMVAPHLHRKVTVHHADCFTWEPPKGARWDTVWHDIWDTISEENLPEMARLHRKYGRRCDHQASWMRGWLESERRRYG